VALAISTPLASAQIKYLPVAVQVSVPLLGVVGWLAARELAGIRVADEQARSPADQPRTPGGT